MCKMRHIHLNIDLAVAIESDGDRICYGLSCGKVDRACARRICPWENTQITARRRSDHPHIANHSYGASWHKQSVYNHSTHLYAMNRPGSERVVHTCIKKANRIG